MDAQNLQGNPPTILCLRCGKEMKPIGPFALVPVDLQKKIAHPEHTIPAMGIACECGYFELRPAPGGPEDSGGPSGAGEDAPGWPASAGGKLAPAEDPSF